MRTKQFVKYFCQKEGPPLARNISANISVERVLAQFCATRRRAIICTNFQFGVSLAPVIILNLWWGCPSSHLLYGQYQCFINQRWDKTGRRQFCFKPTCFNNQNIRSWRQRRHYIYIEIYSSLSIVSVCLQNETSFTSLESRFLISDQLDIPSLATALPLEGQFQCGRRVAMIDMK